MKTIGSGNLQQKKTLKRRHYSTMLNWIKKEGNAIASSSQIKYLMQKKI